MYDIRRGNEPLREKEKREDDWVEEFSVVSELETYSEKGGGLMGKGAKE